MIYEAVIEVLGEPLSQGQADIAYIVSGVLLCLACFALIMVARWLTKI